MLGAELIAAALGGYLIGAVPFGVLVGRLRGTDPRASGSGRTGATNALRALGAGWAAAVAVLDVAKGIGAVLIGFALATRLNGDPSWAGAVAGVGAVVGHVRSIFIGLGGGRGVATGGGAMVVLAPLAVAAAVPIFGVLVWRTRFVSLGSIGAAITAALAALALYASGRASAGAAAAAVLVGIVVVVAHADNIGRLRSGTERRLGESRGPSGG